jgi:hypothetical protein
MANNEFIENQTKRENVTFRDTNILEAFGGDIVRSTRWPTLFSLGVSNANAVPEIDDPDIPVQPEENMTGSGIPMDFAS